jgi:hypothetical protein
VDVEVEFGQAVDFALKNDGIDHDTVPDDVDRILVENPRWNRSQNVFDAVKFQSVSRVRAALETRNDVVFGGQDVNNFSFAFVAPLQS